MPPAHSGDTTLRHGFASQGNAYTSYQFTGQRNETALGLYFYNARWYDPALGLYFYNARWYDPSLGRFTSADTLVPGGAQGYDRYAYADNDPVKYVDPSGHVPCQSGYRCLIRARKMEEANTPPPPTPTTTPTPNATLNAWLTATPTGTLPTPVTILQAGPTQTPTITPSPTAQPLTWKDIEEGFDAIAGPDLSGAPGWYELLPSPIVIPRIGAVDLRSIGKAVDEGLHLIWGAKELIKYAIENQPQPPPTQVNMTSPTPWPTLTSTPIGFPSVTPTPFFRTPTSTPIIPTITPFFP